MKRRFLIERDGEVTGKLELDEDETWSLQKCDDEDECGEIDGDDIDPDDDELDPDDD